jgi:hypothetical protein
MKPFTTAALIILALVAIVHALRVVMGWSVIVNGSDIPMWVSLVAFLVSAGLGSRALARNAHISQTTAAGTPILSRVESAPHLRCRISIEYLRG